MRKIRGIFFLGIWVAILPYLGFPHSWKNVLFSLSGLGVILLSYLLYRDKRAESGEKENFENFRENSEFEERLS